MFQWIGSCIGVRFSALLLCSTLGTMFAVSASGQEGTDATGKLVGQVSFSKKPPKVALVYFSEDTGLTGDVTVDQLNKQFATYLAVGSPGQQMVFKNSADIAHNVYADDPVRGVKFDLGLVEPQSEFSAVRTISWESGGVVKIGCKIHPKMRAYIASLASRFYAVVPLEGRQEASFELEAPEAGLTKVVVWIPKYDRLEVAIASGETLEVTLERNGKPKGTLVLSRE